eukprot:CAMPEP_0115628540 /NCGR_PEP_ID=MMETSP0272-20121206/29464_1 /TAXON_ID=71861 /ORGANISM="Scrippsiella trochoidea, Strain CCMP3099" /LENGTH=125 /DNA_ID=CAMNT_0003065033 /DNA_START=170 /DNA_END=547 /DNA_ORIENTATION=+
MRLTAPEGKSAFLHGLTSPAVWIEIAAHAEQLAPDVSGDGLAWRSATVHSEREGARGVESLPADNMHRWLQAKRLPYHSQSGGIFFKGPEFQRLLGNPGCPIAVLVQLHQERRKCVCGGELTSKE